MREAKLIDEAGEDFASWAPMSRAEEESLVGAMAAVDAWLALPEQRRESKHPASEILLSAAFGLLDTEKGCELLTQHGAKRALAVDDAYSLARFMGMGAKFRPATLADSPHGVYADSWERSLLHHCAQKRLWRCAAYVATLPLARQDMAICEPALREPQPCALREFTPEKFMEIEAQRIMASSTDPKKTKKALEAIKPANDLIFMLLTAHSRDSEHLSMSIAVSEILRGNPLFVAMRLVCDSERGEPGSGPGRKDEEGRAGVQALADLGLFKIESPAHRAALLGLCAPTHDCACEMAQALGLTPEMGSEDSQDELLAKVAAAGGLAGAPAFVDFLGSWGKSQDFPPKVWARAVRELERTLGALARIEERGGARSGSERWHVELATRTVSGLVEAAGNPRSGLAFDATEAMAALRERLDAALLEHGEKLAGDAAYEAARELSRDLGRASLPRTRPKSI